MELRCFHRSPRAIERPELSPDPPKPPAIPLISASSLGRGRKDIRTGSSNRVRPDARSKPRRPRVWREPSEGLWSVAEEKEEIGLGITVA